MFSIFRQTRVLTILSDHKQDMSAKYGVTRLGVFGSVARNEATDGSDVNVIVEMLPDLFRMVHMKAELETLLVAQVDLHSRSQTSQCVLEETY